MLATVHQIRDREVHRAPSLGPPVNPRRKESLANRRRRIARVIDANGRRAWHLMHCIRDAKFGPDPEAALVYVQELRDALDLVLKKSLPR